MTGAAEPFLYISFGHIANVKIYDIRVTAVEKQTTGLYYMVIYFTNIIQ